MTGAPVTNLAAVRALIADAQPLPQVEKLRDSPDPSLPRNGEMPGKRTWRNDKGWEPNALGLPRNCPVLPLGLAGNTAWFIDPIGQVQQLAPPYGKGHILGLFLGDANYLAWGWPRWGKDGNGIGGYAAEEASAALVAACAAKGPWNSVEKVRGRGAWLGPGGDLLVHTGTRLRYAGKWASPGEIEGYVYPTRPALPTPWPESIDDSTSPIRLLRPLLDAWAWARPDVDPALLLGWIAAAPFGGALPWRPAVYLTGDAATGKSTLQRLIKCLLGDYLIQAVDTTGAGIYQHVGNDALPIAVDELEGESDTRKARAVLKLARIAASGGLMLRGGDRHNPVEFRARSCFIFSSINTPPLEPQDLSRMAILRLARIPAGKPAPELDEKALAVIGRCIIRRMMDEWHRFDATFNAFRAELAKGGMDGRGQDTFGTLLACADMVQHQMDKQAKGETDAEYAARIAAGIEERMRVPSDGDLVSISTLMAVGRMHEFEDRAENWRLCLSHLLNVRVDAWRSGSRAAIGKVLLDLWDAKDDMNEGVARSMLAQVGIGLVNRRKGHRDWWLAVPNQNPLTRQLFDGSKWAGDIGAGVWAGALRQSPYGRIHDVAKARVNGDVQACTLISLAGLYGEGGIMRISEEDEA